MTSKQLIEELEDLRAQNEKYRNLLENSRDMLYRISLPEGIYEYVNPASIEITGYSPEELYHSPLLIKNIIHPDWQDYFATQWRLLLSGAPPPYYEYQIIDKSGNEKWIYQKNALIRNSEGKAVALEGIVSDITGYKRIEAALRESESRLLEAQQMAHIGNWYWDVKTGKVEWSKEVYNIFGLDPEKFKPEINSILSLSPWPEENRRDKELINKVIENHETGSYEQKFLFPDGSIGYYFSNFMGIYDDNGELSAIKGTVQDITERKRSEESLKNSEARFRDLAEMLPEGVFETDADFNIIYANNRAFELFGYAREDMYNGIKIFNMITPEDRNNAKENIAKRLNGQNHGGVEYNAIRKNGTVFPILLHAVPVKKDNKLKGFRGIIVDIADRKLEEKEKEKLEEQYRQAQKVESIGRLAGGVAHDLNNLLSPILGYAELLIHDLTSGGIKKEPLEEIVRAALRARELVGQLLAFGRKQTLEYKTLDMNQIVSGLEKLLRRTIRENINIRINTSDRTLTARADAGQIEQVILNLAINAQDAMQAGGILSIETDIAEHDKEYIDNHFGAKPGKFVMLAISDTGSGMDDEVREQIFEPFFSTKGEMGTGLGLATVYGIIKQHGGNIYVYSEPGRGTIFKIYLPCSEDSDAENYTHKNNPAELPGSETILLAEDNEQVRRLSRLILQKYGYTVIEAENGKEALSALDSHDGPVHLLLTDVIMPGMTGNDLFSEAVIKHPDLKVLYMSGYTNNVIASHGILHEGIEFIQKPFLSETLVSRIREILDDD